MRWPLQKHSNDCHQERCDQWHSENELFNRMVENGAAQTFCTAVHKSLFIIRMAMRLEQKMGGCVFSEGEQRTFLV
jgi:hypothetical protein